MVRVAVFSDIHANYSASSAVFEHMRKKFSPINKIWFLGDLFGYGSDALQVWNQINRIRPQVILAGNHDLALMGNERMISMMNENARCMIVSQKNFLQTYAKEIFIRTSKITQKKMLLGKTPIVLSHAVPAMTIEDSTITYEKDVITSNNHQERNAIQIKKEITPNVPIWIIGHSHKQTAWIYKDRNKEWQTAINGFGQSLNGTPNFNVNIDGNENITAKLLMEYSELDSEDLLILNPGSVGMPRDGDYNNIKGKRIAKYMLLNFHKDKFESNFISVPY